MSGKDFTKVKKGALWMSEGRGKRDAALLRQEYTRVCSDKNKESKWSE